MKMVLAIAVLFAAPAYSQVSTATGNWENIPRVTKRGNQSYSAFAMTKLDAALTSDCMKRERRNQIVDVSIPFLIEFGSDKSVKRVVVKKLDCPQAEALIGGVVLELAKTGEYRPTGENQANWYRGEIELSSR